MGTGTLVWFRDDLGLLSRVMFDRRKGHTYNAVYLGLYDS
jgi:hypothetical protein